MRQPRTDIPGLILGVPTAKDGLHFFTRILTWRYGMDPLPDHAALLGNLVRWAAGKNPVVTIDGPGRVGSYLYRQEDRLILHLVNETGADNQRSLVEEFVPGGSLQMQSEPAGGGAKERD